MKSRNKALVTILALLASSTSALAADLVIVEPPFEPAEEEEAYDWTGLYLGLQAGFGFARLQQTSGPAFLLDQDYIDLSGPFVGIHGGYNLQIGRLVLGVEGDINAASIGGDFIWGPPGPGRLEFPGSARLDWFGSLRGRLGFGLDRTLLFGTAGVAAAGVGIDLSPIPISDYATYVGWTAGLGLEHAFNEDWLGRLEYRYYDFGTQALFGGLMPERDFAATMHTVSLGITRKF